MRQTRSIENADDWFWSRVDCANGKESCWEWTGGRMPSGYGQISFMGRPQGAHRLAYQFAIGDIPAGFSILHRCDNPPCCNPAHLFTGTARDNAQDALAKGRFVVGERNGYAKLSDSDIASIKHLYAIGAYTQTELAKKYGVYQSTIQRRVDGKGKGWNFLATNNPSSKLSSEIVRDIRLRCSQGERQNAIARSLGISPGTVCDIIKGRTWAHLE